MSLLSPLCALDVGSVTTRMWFENAKKSFEINTPSSLIKSGRVSDDDRFGSFLHTLFFTHERSLLGIARPRVVASVPCCFTSVEKHALVRACALGGASGTQLVSTALCAASGAGVDLQSPRASLMLSCGSGCSELGVVVSGTQISSCELSCTVQACTTALIRRVKHDLHVSVSPVAMEKLIRTQVSLLEDKKDQHVSGKDDLTGDAKEVVIPWELLMDETKQFFQEQCAFIQKAIRKMDSSLSADILEQGILLYGGLSQLPGLSLFLSTTLRLPVSVVPEPTTCVITGLKDIASSITFTEYDTENEEYQVLGC